MPKCPECGSEDVTKAGHNEWRIVSKDPLSRKQVQRYRCTKCGRVFVPPEEWKSEVISDSRT